MRYTFRQLEVFLATAHHKNITRAADSLAMSQSAASGALKDLESQFGIQLFDRVGKRLQPNELGERIRGKAEALLEQARELEHDLQQHDQLGLLRVGATLTIGNYVCADLIQTYMQHARATLEIANTEHITEAILNFDIDVGLIEGELQHPELDITPWRSDKLACFCHPEHPFAHRNDVTVEEVLTQPWVLRESGSGTRQAFDRTMTGVAPMLNIILELQHTEAIKRSVEKKLGVSCLSEIALNRNFERGELAPFSIENKNFTRKFYIVLHKQKYLSAGIKHWLNLCEIEASI